MNAGRARRASGWLLVAAGAAVGVGAGPVGVAHADETHHAGSHNGPVVALVHTGQVDDPMEDVLEHTLLFGDGYTWD